MKIILVASLLATLASSAKLPSSFKKCNRKQSDFDKCMADAVSGAMAQLNKPFKEVGLPNLHPLEVPSVTIARGTSAVGLEQKFTNMKIYGFTEMVCPRFDIDFERKIIQVNCNSPEIRLEADYKINGKILLLEVYGEGDSVIIMENLEIPINYTLTEYDKNGEKYYELAKVDMRLEPKLVKLRFENLFNGDKTLSDNIHTVVNENWKEVFDDVKDSYEDAFEQITKSVFGSLLSRVPISELFENN